MNKKLRIFFYVVGGVLLYLFFLFFVFPYNTLKTRITAEFDKQLGAAYGLKIDSMDVSIFGNLHLKKVEIFKKGKEGDALIFKSPKVVLGVSPFSLMMGKMNIDFDIQGDKGSIEGVVKQSGSQIVVQIEFDDFSMSNIQLLMLVPGLKDSNASYDGTLDGECELTLNQKNPKKNQGIIDLNVANFAVGAFKFTQNLMGAEQEIAIPKIILSKKKGSKILAKLESTKLSLESLTLKEGDLELDLKGDVIAPLRGMVFRFDLEGEFKFSQRLEKEIPYLSFLNEQKNAQGVFPITIRGNTRRPLVKINQFQLPLHLF